MKVDFIVRAAHERGFGGGRVPRRGDESRPQSVRIRVHPRRLTFVVYPCSSASREEAISGKE
jgi:hypothetical protein